MSSLLSLKWWSYFLLLITICWEREWGWVKVPLKVCFEILQDALRANAFRNIWDVLCNDKHTVFPSPHIADICRTPKQQALLWTSDSIISPVPFQSLSSANLINHKSLLSWVLAAEESLSQRPMCQNINTWNIFLKVRCIWRVIVVRAPHPLHWYYFPLLNHNMSSGWAPYHYPTGEFSVCAWICIYMAFSYTVSQTTDRAMNHRPVEWWRNASRWLLCHSAGASHRQHSWQYWGPQLIFAKQLNQRKAGWPRKDHTSLLFWRGHIIFIARSSSGVTKGILKGSSQLLLLLFCPAWHPLNTHIPPSFHCSSPKH